MLNKHGAGEFFGEVSLLDGEGRSATAVAYEPSKLVHIGRDRLMAFLKQRPEAMLRIVELLCTRMRRVTHLVEDSLFLDVSTRFGPAGRRPGRCRRHAKGDLFRHPPPLAERPCPHAVRSREFVSKQLSLWRTPKIIELGRRLLTIRDRKALERLCNGERGDLRRPPDLSEKDHEV